MGAPLVIQIPFKALVADNERHTILKAKHGKRIGSTDRYRTCLAVCSMLAATQYAKQGGVKLKGSVRLTITIYEPDKRARDIGNYIKMIADCLIATVYVDDSQIDELVVRRAARDRFNPRAEIVAEEIAA